MLRFPVKLSSHKIPLQGEWEEPYEGRVGYVICVGSGSHLVAFPHDLALPFNPFKFHVDQMVPIASPSNPYGKHDVLADMLRSEKEWTLKIEFLQKNWKHFDGGFHVNKFAGEMVKSFGTDAGWQKAVKLSRDLGVAMYSCMSQNKAAIKAGKLEVYGNIEEKLVQAMGYTATGIPTQAENVARAIFQQLLVRAFEKFPETLSSGEAEFALRNGIEEPESILKRVGNCRGKWVFTPPIEAIKMLDEALKKQT